jgi:crotonobetainyl-CoA:carnitine CoA-transferase CaiB-like acyl-CoA transferase
MLLGDLGADVMKIEHPRRGDNTRYMNVSKRFRTDIPRAGGDYFMAINRNKRSLTLELKTDEGREIASELAAWADVAVQNFRPGVMKKLGLDYEDLSARNPRLIYASLDAYGDHGELAHQPGMDVAVQARTGIMSITGEVGSSRPIKPGVSIADFAGGTHLVIAVQAALFHRERTGEGQHVKVSLLAATMSMLSNYCVAVLDGEAEMKPMGSGHPQLVPFQAFSTKDGSIVISPGTNKLFRELCTVIGLESLAEDERFLTNPSRVDHRQALIEILERKIVERTTNEWLEVFEMNEIPCAPVLNMHQAFTQEQVRSNGIIAEMDHPIAGRFHTVRAPYRMSKTPCVTPKAPPVMGADNSEILRDILGRSSEEIARLADLGIIGADDQAPAE